MCTRSCHEVVVNACKLEVLVVDLAQIHHLGTLNNKNTRFGILKNKKLLFRSIASEMKNEPHIFSLLQTSEHNREANWHPCWLGSGMPWKVDHMGTFIVESNRVFLRWEGMFSSWWSNKISKDLCSLDIWNPCQEFF